MTFDDYADEQPDPELLAQIQAARDHHREAIHHPDPRDPDHPAEADE